jgi:hypothetical protein
MRPLGLKIPALPRWWYPCRYSHSMRILTLLMPGLPLFLPVCSLFMPGQPLFLLVCSCVRPALPARWPLYHCHCCAHSTSLWCLHIPHRCDYSLEMVFCSKCRVICVQCMPICIYCRSIQTAATVQKYIPCATSSRVYISRRSTLCISSRAASTYIGPVCVSSARAVRADDPPGMSLSA